MCRSLSISLPEDWWLNQAIYTTADSSHMSANSKPCFHIERDLKTINFSANHFNIVLFVMEYDIVLQTQHYFNKQEDYLQHQCWKFVKKKIYACSYLSVCSLINWFWTKKVPHLYIFKTRNVCFYVHIRMLIVIFRATNSISWLPNNTKVRFHWSVPSHKGQHIFIISKSNSARHVLHARITN